VDQEEKACGGIFAGTPSDRNTSNADRRVQTASGNANAAPMPRRGQASPQIYRQSHYVYAI